MLQSGKFCENVMMPYKPQPPLDNFVDFFWFQENYIALNYRRERILPTGAVEIIINLHHEPLTLFTGRGEAHNFTSAFICGPHSEFFTIDTSQPQFVLGVHFKPGGAFPFLGLPANTLLNTIIPLEAVWGRRAHHLHDQLLTAQTWQQRFSFLEATLMQCQSPTRHPAVTFALRELMHAPHQKISNLTNQLGMSAQWFSQLFQQQVGLSPKRFYRVQRFYQVLNLLHKESQIEWTQIALNCGYFDQAHFIRDFQAFSGFNPTTYLTHIHQDMPSIDLPHPEVILRQAT